MAETASGGALTPSHTAGQGEDEPRAPLAILQAAPQANDTGQPIAEPPPIIEPVGFDDPFETRPVVAPQRPMRRRFLAPVATGSLYAERSSSYDRAQTPEPLPHQEPYPPTLEHAPAAPVPAGNPAPQSSGPPPLLVEPPPHPLEPLPQSGPEPRRRNRRVVALQLGLLVLLIAIVALGLRPKPGDAEADLAQGIRYAKGEGTRQDYTAAAKWFRAAADQGLPRAQYDLGVLYERGRGVPLDYGQAVMWYKRAAEGRHPLAEYNLAVAYSKGEGIERNLFEAAVWYNRAALQGVVAAMVNLAILYERGDGVAVSPSTAYAWYRVAARRGSQPAARRADELLQAFSAWDQTQAEAKTREVTLSIQDSVGESARVAAQAKPSMMADGAASNLRSGFDKQPAPGPPSQPVDAGDVNP